MVHDYDIDIIQQLNIFVVLEISNFDEAVQKNMYRGPCCVEN